MCPLTNKNYTYSKYKPRGANVVEISSIFMSFPTEGNFNWIYHVMILNEGYELLPTACCRNVLDFLPLLEYTISYYTNNL